MSEQQLKEPAAEVPASDVFLRMRERMATFEKKWHEWHAAGQPNSKTCATHDELRKVNFENSVRASWRDEQMQIVYQPCPKCRADELLRSKSAELKTFGVPDLLLHSSLENFVAQTPEEIENLNMACEFAARGKGFLVMLGPVGNGKSHLAVGVIRKMECRARFVTHSDLLKRLRDTYRNDKAEDVIEACKRVRLLVLDEIGLSVGGRDELPMLHDILSERHNSRKPTILTTNLDRPALDATLGERMADRLSQSGFKILNFTGASKRRTMKNQY